MRPSGSPHGPRGVHVPGSYSGAGAHSPSLASLQLADLDEVAKARVGGSPARSWSCRTTRLARPVRRLATRVRDALGDRVLGLEHVGSTSVPGLAAEPVIDLTLIVVDSGDEPAYVPDLEAAGFPLRVREPKWEEHRVLTLEGPQTNLHVYSPGSGEPASVRMFRDWLSGHHEDRAAYGALKSELAGRGFAESWTTTTTRARWSTTSTRGRSRPTPRTSTTSSRAPDDPAQGSRQVGIEST